MAAAAPPPVRLQGSIPLPGPLTLQGSCALPASDDLVAAYLTLNGKLYRAVDLATGETLYTTAEALHTLRAVAKLILPLTLPPTSPLKSPHPYVLTERGAFATTQEALNPQRPPIAYIPQAERDNYPQHLRAIQELFSSLEDTQFTPQSQMPPYRKKGVLDP